jgi:hypothetical protein
MKTKLCYFDFDGTLISTPIASPENKEKWANYYGKPWPHRGWWGRPESLDTGVWDMEPIKEVYDDYIKYSEDPSCLMIMSTGRLEPLADLVKGILDDNGLYFDYYFFNKGGNTINEKIKYLDLILYRYPTIRDIELWDDRPKHFGDFKNWGQEMKAKGRIDSFYLNEIQSDQWTNFVE